MTLRLDLRWTDPPNGAEAGRALGWGEGLLYVGEIPVWFRKSADDPEPIAWSWIELLEFLARRWAYLKAEQAYPLDLTPAHPMELRKALERFWREEYRTDSQREDDDEAVFRFEQRHDLARALRGITLPSVLVLREGLKAWVCTDQAELQVRHDELMADLEGIGEQIAAYLADATHSERAQVAVQAWKSREQIAPQKLVELATGLSGSVLGRNPDWQSLEFWGLRALGDDSELCAAARFVPGGLPSEVDRQVIFEVIRAIPAGNLERLNEISTAVRKELDPREEPHEQGYRLADVTTNTLQLEQGAADPERVLRSLGVEIIERRLSSMIDAVGCWGPNHGPAIILNPRGKRAHSSAGRRATLAHELCHLLVDRTSALPLAEVLGGRSPKVPEQRAGAFAAQLLLPKWAARNSYKRHLSIWEALDELTREYQVSRALAANQLYYAKFTGCTAAELEQLLRLMQRDDDE